MLKLKWKGTILDDEENVTGTIEVPNLSEENDSESIDVSAWALIMVAGYGCSDGAPTTVQVIVTTDKSCSASQQLKEMLHCQAPPVVRERLESYITSLKNGVCV